jgi:hypothetical protein
MKALSRVFEPDVDSLGIIEMEPFERNTVQEGLAWRIM